MEKMGLVWNVQRRAKSRVPLANATPAFPDVHDMPMKPSVISPEAQPSQKLQDA
jgi:hypothetical protein